jgi:hypothetical protein
MNAVIGALRIFLGLDAASFDKGVDKAKAKADGLASHFKKVNQALASFGGGLATGFLGAGLTSLLFGLKQAAESLGDIGDAAANLGLTTEQLQKLQYAASSAGMTADELTTAMGRFNDKIGDALVDAESLQRFTEKYGVALTDTTGKQRSLNDILGDFAERIKTTGTEAEDFALATDLFGRVYGPKWLEVLREGRDGLEDFGQAAVDAGYVVDGEVIAKAAKFDAAWNVAIDTVSKRLKAFAVEVVSVLSDDTKASFLRRALMASPGALIKTLSGDLPAGPGVENKPPPNSGQRFLDNSTGGFLDIPPLPRSKPGMGGGGGSVSRRAPAREFEDASKAVKIYTDRIGENTTEIEQTVIAQNDLNDSLRDFADIGAGAFDALINGGRSFTDVLKDIAGQLSSQLIYGAFSSIGSLGSGSGLGGSLGSLFAGFFANGGTIGPGKFGVVGERGPELVTAGSSPLSVIPSDMFGGGGQVINIDARGSSLSREEIKAAFLEAQRQTLAQVPATVNRARARGRV